MSFINKVRYIDIVLKCILISVLKKCLSIFNITNNLYNCILVERSLVFQRCGSRAHEYEEQIKLFAIIINNNAAIEIFHNETFFSSIDLCSKHITYLSLWVVSIITAIYYSIVARFVPYTSYSKSIALYFFVLFSKN